MTRRIFIRTYPVQLIPHFCLLFGREIFSFNYRNIRSWHWESIWKKNKKSARENQSTNLFVLVVREFFFRILSWTYRKPSLVCWSICSTPPNEARFLTLIKRDLVDEWNDINDERRYNEELRCSGWFSIRIDGVEFKCDFKCSCHQRYNRIQLSGADIV